MKYRVQIFFSCAIMFMACKEKYVPQLVNEIATGYLVVDGFINSGTGSTTISLSRSTKLSAPGSIVRETKAIVRVIGKTNTVGFLLSEASPGIYTNPQLTLSTADQYRLFIKTTGGKEYYSDYSEVRRTPDIDSLAWNVDNDGVQITAQSHDNSIPVGYYQFKKEETWEFTSAYSSSLKLRFDRDGLILGVMDRFPTGGDDLSIFRCWKTEAPTNILVYSTEKLTKNIVNYPLVAIEQGSWKLSIRYSILFTSLAISHANFQFLEQLRKNTEQLGTIFDAQPSENNGNIRNPANINEPVIGFIEVTEEKQKRIFITNAQVPFWNYNSGCPPEKMVKIAPLPHEIFNTIDIPTHHAGVVNGEAFVLFSRPECVDCTTRGTNKKPSFW